MIPAIQVDNTPATEAVIMYVPKIRLGYQKSITDNPGLVH